jgi:uncharacterized glyoxalase superfamily protein PhnB
MSFTPTVHYIDADRGAQWLSSVLSLKVGLVLKDASDVTWHGELWNEQGSAIFYGSLPADRPPTSGQVTYLHVLGEEGVEIAAARAMALDPDSVLCPPQTMEYGAYEAWLIDPEGNTWVITTYEPTFPE